MTRLVLGLPSKGRLMEDSFGWFAERGIAVRRSGQDRTYAAVAKGLDGLDIALLSAAEIPAALTQGRIHCGVTGDDLVREAMPDRAPRVRRLAALGIGGADVVVAVPAFWIDVETMGDLDQVAARFRARHGHGLRVATKYPNLARAFFHEKGVADYRLIDSQGATEAAPKNLTAEAIVDITSTGETLRANHLRVLDDGLILRSEAALWLADAAVWDGPARRTLRGLAARLGLDAPA
ncbi:MAG TPA: ATP phosphoribosyltransferase [Thermohalobaculum sp.]|nr:ATP phosphoribosyltransferase [Thermohalobaculum sp.]